MVGRAWILWLPFACASFVPTVSAWLTRPLGFSGPQLAGPVGKRTQTATSEVRAVLDIVQVLAECCVALECAGGKMPEQYQQKYATAYAALRAATIQIRQKGGGSELIACLNYMAAWNKCIDELVKKTKRPGKILIPACVFKDLEIFTAREVALT